MTFSFFDDAPTGAVTGGVRQLQVYLQVGGVNLPVIEAEATQRATRQSSTLAASVALDETPTVDESWWMTQAPIQASLFVQAGNLSGTLVTGNLDEVEVDYGQRIVRVSSRDMSAGLHDQKTSKSWINQTPSQIVSELAGMAGLSATASGLSQMAGKLFQIDTVKIANDISLGAIIHKLAEFEGARWWVQGTQFFYQPPNQSTGAYPIVYAAPQNGGPASGNFLALNIKRNMVMAEGITVEIAGWHKKQEKVIRSTMGSGPAKWSYENHNLTQAQSDQWAQSKYNDIIRHQVTILAELCGDPTIDIGQQLSVSGTSADGSYAIDSIRHMISENGYVMSIESRGPDANGQKANAGSALNGPKF